MESKYSESFYIKNLFNKIKVDEIMMKKFIFIHEDDRFSLVEEKLREFNIRHLPVIDDNNKLVGIITQRDLYRIQSPRHLEDDTWYYDQKSLDSHILKYVMTKDPCAINPQDPAAKAVLLMAERKYGCLPVVKKDRTLCGIVTRHDILKIAAQILRE